MASLLTRKDFLVSILGGGFVNVAFAGVAANSADRGGKDRDILIYIFLRGGCDGLNFLTPVAGNDRHIYEEERPNLKMAADGPEGLLKLDGAFGLHPSAKSLLDLFQSKKLALIHAAGLPSNTRSHFDAQNIVELGLADKKVLGSGWLARYLEGIGAEKADPGLLPAVSIGGLEPTSLLSFPQGISVNDPKGFNLLGDKSAQKDQIDALKKIYHSQDSWMATYGSQVLRTLGLMDGRDAEYVPAKNREYPKGEIANRLKVLAQILKMDLGVEVATVDMGGWDTHKYQGTGLEGTFAKQVEQLSDSLGTFYADVNDEGAKGLGKRITIVVMSEFGRRLRENANRGTDHGHGGIMMVLGENIAGGKVYGNWPGLKTEQLYERADLAVTTDYRAILSEVLQKRMKVKNLSKIFPEYKMTHSQSLALSLARE